MSDETRTLNATCLCGAAKHEIEVPTSELPLKALFCHCDSCRHASGTLCYTITFLPSTYEPAQELLDKLVPFALSKRITYFHCKTCGSQMLGHVWYDADDHSKGSGWGAASGTLEQAESVYELLGHQHIADTLDGGFADYLASIDDQPLTRWAHDFQKNEHLPLYWSSPERPEVQPKKEDKLHAHCKCGGVEFWIARPSERSKEASGSWPDVLIPHHSTEPRPDRSAWWLKAGGTKFLGGVCACNSCRLDTGHEWVEWAFVPTIDVSLDPKGEKPFSFDIGTLQHYRSTPEPEGAVRYFCGVCGATVFFRGDERRDLLDIAVGLLDAPEGARAETWLEWRTSRLSFREDSISRAKGLTLGVERGMEDFAKRHQQ